MLFVIPLQNSVDELMLIINRAIEFLSLDPEWTPETNLLLFDDGGNQKGVDLIEAIRKDYPFKFISNEHAAGLGNILSTVFKFASDLSHDKIFFLDGDALASRSLVQDMKKMITLSEEYDIVWGQLAIAEQMSMQRLFEAEWQKEKSFDSWSWSEYQTFITILQDKLFEQINDIFLKMFVLNVKATHRGQWGKIQIDEEGYGALIQLLVQIRKMGLTMVGHTMSELNIRPARFDNSLDNSPQWLQNLEYILDREILLHNNLSNIHEE